MVYLSYLCIIHYLIVIVFDVNGFGFLGSGYACSSYTEPRDATIPPLVFVSVVQLMFVLSNLSNVYGVYC